MEKYVSVEFAERLKVLGFKERVLTYYENGVPKLYNDITGWDFNTSFMTCVSRPTYSEVFRWFRETYNIEAAVACFYSNKLDIPYEQRRYHCHVIRDSITSKGPQYNTYEEAELACLEKLCEIVESKTE